MTDDLNILPRAPSTVRIAGVDKPSLLHALAVHGVRLNQAAEGLFQDPRFAPFEHSYSVEIAYVSVAALGFSEGATYQRITARAFEQGLAECPLELGPHLRLQFLDQIEAPAAAPAGIRGAPPGSITIASRSLDDSELTPRGFYLRRLAGVSWLRGYWSPADHVWTASDVFVFLRGSTAL
jgi:hypothetical protein